jgi:hypothetical protein
MGDSKWKLQKRRVSTWNIKNKSAMAITDKAIAEQGRELALNFRLFLNERLTLRSKQPPINQTDAVTTAKLSTSETTYGNVILTLNKSVKRNTEMTDVLLNERNQDKG